MKKIGNSDVTGVLATLNEEKGYWFYQGSFMLFLMFCGQVCYYVICVLEDLAYCSSGFFLSCLSEAKIAVFVTERVNDDFGG